MHRSKISPNGGKPPGRVLPRESRKLTAETQRRRDAETFFCHARESGHPDKGWVPAFAGTTNLFFSLPLRLCGESF